MKKLFVPLLFLSIFQLAKAQRSDLELNRDSVVGWRYVSNPLNPKAVYKPLKSQYANGATYSVWQQQASDLLINWIQQSYLPRGLVMRTIAKNDGRWYVDANGPLQGYGANFLGFSTHFANGKIDLSCCEQGQLLVAGFNDFPGTYIKGFNQDGLYFFAEQAQFTSGDDDAKLAKEGIDKRIQPNLYPYRTYLDHYHNNGEQVFKFGVVIAKNGEWPFKPVLVKDAIAYYQRQLAAYPDLLKYDYDHRIKEINAAIDRLKPYYNEPAKILNKTLLNDDKGHSAVSPVDIINGKNIDKTFPEYFMLVSATQQTIDQTKKDYPLWMYLNLTPRNVFLEGNPAKFDTKFGTDIPHMINSLLKNFNYDYVYKWLSQPDAMKNIVYTPLNAPAKSSGNNISKPATVSANASSKSKDPYTILYEDFDGYATGQLSATGWHTYGHDGHSFENATLSTINGQSGKWVSIPDAYTFYPDFTKALPSNFTISYDVYFGTNSQNKRSPVYLRLETKDPKKSNPIDLHDINREGFQFSIAMSGEGESNKRYMTAKVDEAISKINTGAFKEKDVAHVVVSVNGVSVAVSINGKEVILDNSVLPAGKSFKRIGWYCSSPTILLGNIFVKSGSPVQNSEVKEPEFAGVVKDNTTTPAAATFETSDYTFQPLEKLESLPPISYPSGFKSSMPALAVESNKAVASLPAFKAPERSSLLNSLPTSPINDAALRKLIEDLKTKVTAKLDQSNTKQIDNYLSSKKIATSIDIAGEAINAWTQGKPTVALYLYCKALQADYTDMNTANNLASLLASYGYADKAIIILKYVNNKVGNSPAVLSNLAVAFYNAGDMNNASLFAANCIDKDSLNTNANKVATFVHLNKASQTNNKAEAEQAIACLKQALKSQYNKEASDLLSKIEANHQKQNDYYNTNFKEFPMLRKLQLPAMPEALTQIKSFNQQVEKEKNAISRTKDLIYAALQKIPKPDYKKLMATTSQNTGMAMQMFKATAITTNSLQWYIKMKKDLEDIFVIKKNELVKKYNNKVNDIAKKYKERLSKLEGGEGKIEEDEQMERLKKQRCEEYNRETADYLSDIAKITNQFAQQSEYVSRIYCRDIANWGCFQRNDYSMRPFMDAQNTYLIDVQKILSFYTQIEPCVYPTQESKEDKKPAKIKEWQGEYCGNFTGSMGVGVAKISFNCNSISLSGGEGFLGQMSLNYNENGSFKDVTLGAGVGVEAHWGNQNIASLSAGVSAMEYVTISAGANGTPQITDWGTTAGVSAGANVGPVGGEVNVLSGKLSAQSGVTAEGAIPDGLKILTH